METATEMTAKEKLQQVMAELGLTVAAEFVPFSKSRNAKPRKDGKVWRSLNWRVTLQIKGRDILTTDYAAGEAHCPAYKASVKEAGHRHSIMRDAEIAWECENGFQAWSGSTGMFARDRTKPLQPDAADVVYSLVADSNVLDYSTFEDWAENLGYDTDSRDAEKVYRACLEIALKLRNGIGEAGLTKLCEACEDY